MSFPAMVLTVIEIGPVYPALPADQRSSLSLKSGVLRDALHDIHASHLIQHLPSSRATQAQVTFELHNCQKLL